MELVVLSRFDCPPGLQKQGSEVEEQSNCIFQADQSLHVLLVIQVPSMFGVRQHS